VWLADVRAPNDPPNQQVFDPRITLRIPLDTLCVTAPCTGAGIVVRLGFDRFGAYQFTLTGRDTDPIGQLCETPSELGSNPVPFIRNISDLGLVTRVESRPTVWLELHHVRPPIRPRRASLFTVR